MRSRILGLVAIVLLSACTAEPGRDETADPGPDAMASTDDTAGRTLRLAVPRIETWDPREVALTDQGAVIVSDLLYDGLTEAPSDGVELRPGLASAWWADDDFTQWRFLIDPGSGVDANTVAASLSSLVTGPRTRSAAALAARIQSVRAPRPDLVVVTLAAPNAGLPWVLSGLPYSVVPADGTPTGDFEIVVDGPDRLELHRRSTGRGPADRFTQVDVRWLGPSDDGAGWLEDGRADGALVATDAGGAATGAVRYHVLNVDSPTLADVAARRAVLESVDVDEVLAAVGEPGLHPVDGLVSPSWAGHQLVAAGEPPAGAGAGSPDQSPTEPVPVPGSEPLSLRITSAGDGQGPVTEAIAAALMAAGHEASADDLAAKELAQAIVDGTTDLFAFGWVAPAGSVDAVLPPLLAPDSPANAARIDGPEVAALLAAAATVADDQERWAILAEAHELALSEAKILPTAVSTSTLQLGEGAEGVSVRPDGSLDLDGSG